MCVRACVPACVCVRAGGTYGAVLPATPRSVPTSFFSSCPRGRSQPKWEEEQAGSGDLAPAFPADQGPGVQALHIRMPLLHFC